MARRATANLEAALRAAILAELEEQGFAGLTYEGVARRAATSKPVLYRRYSSRAAMVLNALAGRLREHFPADLHGPLREDVIAMLRFADDRVAAVGVDTFRALVGESDTEAREVLSAAIVSSELFLSERVVAQAVARGELGPAPIPKASLRAPFAVLREQVLLRTDAALTLDQIVDDVCLPLFKALSYRRYEPDPAGGGNSLSG